MSKTYKSIPFFSDEIVIRPHAATEREHLDRPITIQRFSGGLPVSLSENEETGALRAECAIGFIEGFEQDLNSKDETMKHIENTDENIERLAQHIVEFGMDTGDLMNYVKDSLETYYKENPDMFVLDWEDQLGYKPGAS